MYRRECSGINLVLRLKKICWHLEHNANASIVTLGSRSERLLLGRPFHLYVLRLV